MPSKATPVVLAILGTLALAMPAGAATGEAKTRPLPPAQSGDGQNRRVRIHNQTGWTITAISVSDARGGDWRAAVLGRDAVASGESVLVNVDDGAGACVYVLRAEFANGQALERDNVNACRIADYYFTR